MYKLTLLTSFVITRHYNTGGQGLGSNDFILTIFVVSFDPNFNSFHRVYSQELTTLHFKHVFTLCVYKEHKMKA
jgi:hypothetical protein